MAVIEAIFFVITGYDIVIRWEKMCFLLGLSMIRVFWKPELNRIIRNVHLLRPKQKTRFGLGFVFFFFVADLCPLWPTRYWKKEIDFAFILSDWQNHYIWFSFFQKTPNSKSQNSSTWQPATTNRSRPITSRLQQLSHHWAPPRHSCRRQRSPLSISHLQHTKTQRHTSPPLGRPMHRT